MKILRNGIVAAALAVCALLPAPPASADVVGAGTCPEGYQGIIVSVDSPSTGKREVLICWKPTHWT